MGETLKRVGATVGLCLTWFLTVYLCALIGHGLFGFAMAVLVGIVGFFAGAVCFALVLGDDDGPTAAFGLGWWLAAFVGLLCIAGAGGAYEAHAGQPVPVLVTDVRCQQNDDGCLWQARVSTSATEHDLGWLDECDVHYQPGDDAVVLGDPHGRFGPALTTCASTDRDIGIFIVSSALYVVALTLAQVLHFLVRPVRLRWRHRARRRALRWGGG